jgi:hypothetical protein
MEFKKMQESKANEFINNKIFIAFGTTKEEVTRKLEEQGADTSSIIGLGAGAYVQEKDYKETMKFFDKIAKENHEFTLNNIYEVCKYEFGNYEMEISLSYTYDSFLREVLDLTTEEIKANVADINRAIKDYKKEFWEANA